MKERRPLVLIELLVMLLVFSLAAAFCLKAFAWADNRSVELQQQAQAAVEAQNAAELLKHTRGDYARLGMILDAGKWCCFYDADWHACQRGGSFLLQITPEICDTEGLAGARVEVYREDGQCLIALTVRWQETVK